MQHDHVMIKLSFDPIPRVSGGLRANICHHVAAFVILFNLICNMAMFNFDPNSRVRERSAGKIFATTAAFGDSL